MATVERDDRGMWKKALITVPAIVIAGSLIGVVSNNGFGNDWYAPLTKPAFQPPSWAFGVVWTILYTMMGIALAAILNERPSEQRSHALALFYTQLAMNFAWSPVFFGLGLIDVAYILLIGLVVVALLTAIAFRRIRRVAGFLLLPYLVWLCLASALNYETGRLNPGADRAPLGITGD